MNDGHKNNDKEIRMNCANTLFAQVGQRTEVNIEHKNGGCDVDRDSEISNKIHVFSPLLFFI